MTTAMVECRKCEDNKISSEGSDSCRQCPANSGESANEAHTQCGKLNLLICLFVNIKETTAIITKACN